MKKEITFLVATLVSTQAWAQGKKAAPEKAPFAVATLAPRSGSKMTGKVQFTRGPKGLEVVASVSGGTAPGQHGFHIHEKGDCSAPDASSAGGHYNPTGAVHADPNASARHVGDLGNITLQDDGSGQLKLEVPPIKGFTNWDDIIGKSVVLHAKVDDLKTQPSGAAGDRIACGVIEAAPKPKK